MTAPYDYPLNTLQLHWMPASVARMVPNHSARASPCGSCATLWAHVCVSRMCLFVSYFAYNICSISGMYGHLTTLNKVRGVSTGVTATAPSRRSPRDEDDDEDAHHVIKQVRIDPSHARDRLVLP